MAQKCSIWGYVREVCTPSRPPPDSHLLLFKFSILSTNATLSEYPTEKSCDISSFASQGQTLYESWNVQSSTYHHNVFTPVYSGWTWIVEYGPPLRPQVTNESCKLYLPIMQTFSFLITVSLSLDAMILKKNQKPCWWSKCGLLPL